MLNNGGKELLKELYAEILKAETEEEIGEFLEDLCTIKELESMSQRLKAAKMLLQGKTYNEIQKEYGISHSALANWIKLYSEVKIDDDTVITAEQIKALQKRNAQLEEENLILKKAIAIFTPHSDKE